MTAALAQLTEAGRDRMLIGGEWLAASDGSVMEVLDPATARPVAEVPNGALADARQAVDAAWEALPAWAEAAPRRRAEILRRSFELMTERADQLAALIVLEMGKTFAESKGEVAYAAEFFRWFAEEAVRADGSIAAAPGGDKRIMAIGQPIGVCLLITPWNFPAAMATRKIAPALAAGCPVILKPASDTPLTALAVAGLMEEAGVPPGVVNVLPCNRSAEAVPAILRDRRVRKVSFTGSTEVGRILLAQAAENIVSASMELGGNSPFLVLEDADVEAAVAGAMVAKMRNGGQSCIAANRFYVHQSLADEFARSFSAAMSGVRVGPGMEEGAELGPLINLRAQRDMEEAVRAARDSGSRLLTGGAAPDREGFFFEPTVLDRTPADSPVLDNEIFGPVAPIVAFESEEQAIALANDTVHGLAAYLYSSDLARALRVAEALESGMVGINRGLISDPAAPFGGVKQSGIGREGGHEGMKEFQEIKYIAVDW